MASTTLMNGERGKISSLVVVKKLPAIFVTEYYRREDVHCAIRMIHLSLTNKGNYNENR